MEELKEYTIPFIGLKLGEHRFNFEITNTFFEHFGYTDFDHANVKLDVLMDKKSTLLDISLNFDGIVGVHCDITNEPFDQDLSGTYHFVVKFGEEFNNENEDLLILPHGSHEVNIQQFVYESIVLSVPTRNIHPGVGDGTLKSEILERLEELRPKGSSDSEKENEDTDPRWDELKKLLTDK